MMETYEEQVAYKEYPPERYYDPTKYPDNYKNQYCMYFLSWAGENKYDISFSCGRYIRNISRYKKQFKTLDSGASNCKCGRIASQGELG